MRIVLTLLITLLTDVYDWDEYQDFKKLVLPPFQFLQSLNEPALTHS